MTKQRRLLWLTLLIAFAALPLSAQESAASSSSGTIDNPSEWSGLGRSCNGFGFAKIGSCAALVFTGQHFHLAVGNLAPQNGFGAGLAYVRFLKPTETWRPSLNADAVATPNESWRAGVYLKLVHSPDFTTTVHYGPPEIKSNLTELPEHTVVNLYAQAESLNKATFFGLGPDSTEAGRTYFGMREVIAGSNVIKPLFARLNAALLGEVNGRFVSIRPSEDNGSPTVGAVYTEATAPGLTTQPAFLQLGEGIRMRPVFWNDYAHLDYQVAYQQFFAPRASRFSFERLTLDFSQSFAIYKSTTRIPVPREANGPDECSIDRVRDFPACSLNKKVQVQNCQNTYPSNAAPCKAIARDLQGSVSFRVFFATSFTPDQHVVPFYLQPTLGGSDLNGAISLPSYQDYRFRAPHVFLLQQAFEHTVWGPIGFAFTADEGKVALARGDFGSSPWLHSFATGLTLRAGNFPQVFVLFAWGGKEGTHTIASVNTSLLGGSSRPSLY